MRQLKMVAMFLKSVLDTLGSSVSAVHPSGQWRNPHVRTIYVVPLYHKTDNNHFKYVYNVSLYFSLFNMLNEFTYLKSGENFIVRVLIIRKFVT